MIEDILQVGHLKNWYLLNICSTFISNKLKNLGKSTPNANPVPQHMTIHADLLSPEKMGMSFTEVAPDNSCH